MLREAEPCGWGLRCKIRTARCPPACQPARSASERESLTRGWAPAPNLAAGLLGQSTRAMLAKRVNCSRKASRVIPVGPLRCFDTMISACPRSGESG
jgi:hypothetical protein